MIDEAGFITERRLPSVNPSVSLTGEFINAIYEGTIPELEIVIGDNCKTSISDYLKVKQDANGSMLKRRTKDKRTGQTYEEAGHFSDTKRYFITEAFKSIYTNHSLRRKNNEFQSMKYFTSSKIDLSKSTCVIRIVPFVNDWFAAVVSKLIDDKIYITDVLFNQDPHSSIQNVIAFANICEVEEISFEANATWFDTGRTLRSSTDAPVRIITENPKKESRIAAFSEFIKANMYFRDDYDKEPEYSAFIDNLFDCFKGKNIEAANILSGLAEYYKRQNQENW